MNDMMEAEALQYEMNKLLDTVDAISNDELWLPTHNEMRDIKKRFNKVMELYKSLVESDSRKTGENAAAYKSDLRLLGKEMKAQYDKGASLRRIAEHYHCAPGTVKKILYEMQTADPEYGESIAETDQYSGNKSKVQYDDGYDFELPF